MLLVVCQTESKKDPETWITAAWGREPRTQMPPGFLSSIAVSASLRALALFSPLRNWFLHGARAMAAGSSTSIPKHKSHFQRILAGTCVTCPARCVWRWEYYNRHASLEPHHKIEKKSITPKKSIGCLDRNEALLYSVCAMCMQME